MFAIIRNFFNGILTWAERRIAWEQGYRLCDTVKVNWEEKLTEEYRAAAKRYGKEEEIDII